MSCGSLAIVAVTVSPLRTTLLAQICSPDPSPLLVAYLIFTAKPLSPGCGLALRAKNTGNVLFALAIAALTASFFGETSVKFWAAAGPFIAASSTNTPSARCRIDPAMFHLHGVSGQVIAPTRI